MSFGPTITASNLAPAPEKVSSVCLGAFLPGEADRLFPFKDDDPAIAHMGAHFGGQLLARSSVDFVRPLELETSQIVWGVHHASTLVGFTWFSYYPTLPNKHVGFSLVLSQEARNKGIGALTTAAMLSAAMRPGVLHDVSPLYPPDIPDLDTFIHPTNPVSRGMCNSFGFRHVGARRIEGGGKVIWDRHILPTKRTRSTEQLTRVQHGSARIAFARAMSRYAVTVPGI